MSRMCLFFVVKSSSSKAHAFVGKEMDSEEEFAYEEAEVESEEESDSGVARLALASAYVAKSIFHIEDNGLVTNTDANDEDDSAPTYCFMACCAKVNSCDAYFKYQVKMTLNVNLNLAKNTC